MFWVHCNYCGIQPSQHRVRIFISSCGHFFCENCARHCHGQKCLVCNTSPVRCVKVDQNLKADVRCMLEDPCESLRKYYKATEFQDAQARNLTNLFKKNVATMGAQLQNISKQNAMLQSQLSEDHRRMQKVEDEKKELQASLSKLKEKVRRSPAPTQHQLQHQQRLHQHSHQHQVGLPKPAFPTMSGFMQSTTSPTVRRGGGLASMQAGTFDDLPNNIFSSVKTPDIFKIHREKNQNNFMQRAAARPSSGPQSRPLAITKPIFDESVQRFPFLS